LTRYFARDPHELRLSVSAVVWRDAQRRELLLMQRSDNRHWGLPGGYVEVGETVAAAAAREVYEETGVRVLVGRLAGVYSDPARQVIEYPDGRRVQAINLCFEAFPATERADSPTTPDETLATGYFSPDALPEPLVPIHRLRIEDVLERDALPRVR
jgi:ADP-ribose pyrophosphatase YjhB (NUDIX family)